MEALVWLIKRVYFILTHQVYDVRVQKIFECTRVYFQKNIII